MRFQLSIDGNKKVHDSYRKTSAGKGSYDLIEKNLEKFKKLSNNIYMRATITPDNINICETYSHFKKSKAFVT